MAEQVDIPLESHDDETSKLNDPSVPPEYQSPKIDFNEGWKDRGFAIIFWIYLTVVIVTSLVLGIPAIQSYAEHMKHHGKPTLFDINMTLLLYLFTGTIATASLMSFVTFFFLQLCAGRMIIFALVLIILVLLVLCVVLILFVNSQLVCVPIFFIMLTLIFAWLIRKRIRFAETHIQIACAVLRQHPSLVLMAIFMLVLQVVWFMFWSLLMLGTLHAANRPLFVYFINRLTSDSFRNEYKHSSLAQTEEQQDSYWHSSIIANVIVFSTLFFWYWAAVIFTNIIHFISACAVGRWWFPNDTNEQYRLTNSIKRAFTTNLGTIAFGSLFEWFIKPLQMCINSRRRHFITVCAECILSIIEKIIGYINEWAFVYSALTGQSFIQAGKSFFNLLKLRSWTMIINDSIVGNCLGFVNIVVGLTTATVGTLIFYLFFSTAWEELAVAIITVSFVGFCLGLIFNATLTIILKSCVRAAFVCFALNPAALGATHPDYLQRLTDIWHEFYPNEFGTSGYTSQFPKTTSENYA